MPDLHRLARRHPTQGRRDPTLDAEREPLEGYGNMPRGPLGLVVEKKRGRGGQEWPEEEEYCSRCPAPDRQEDAPEADGPEPSDNSRPHAPSTHKETQGTVRHSNHTDSGGTASRVRGGPQENDPGATQ